MRHLTFCMVLVVSALLGCGPSKSGPDATVQGTVTIDGMLAERGIVSFYPVEEGPIANGSIKADGTFALRVGQGDLANANFSKIHSGEYWVSVVVRGPSKVQEDHPELPPTPGLLLSAKRFSQKDTSGLKFNVTTGLNILPINVEGSASDPVESILEEATVVLEKNVAEANQDDLAPAEALNTDSDTNTGEVDQ